MRHFRKTTYIGGTTTDSGTFDVKKISVVNGAQTIGSLSAAKAEGADLGKIFVHMRLISLADTPEGFSTSVTRSNNTQNSLNPGDFVALDPNQERLRKEAASFGIIYSYRRGEADPPEANGFTVRSATIAAACASGDLRLAVLAKRYISGLWEDIKKDPYASLFNDETSAAYLWNLVQLMNEVDRFLESRAASLAGRAKLVAIHGNRFILFNVFSRMDLFALRTGGVDLKSHKQKARKLAASVLKAVIAGVEDLFPESYPGNIFKNQDKQKDLLERL